MIPENLRGFWTADRIANVCKNLASEADRGMK